MRSLSKEAERKLISAIEKAAARVNDGDKPTDAIIKSAREHDIPAGHINLMVHAYNTGRTTTQREKGESTLEKAAEFPLAAADDVLKALYPETVKSSSAIKRAEAISTEYALPVTGMLARRRDEMQKAAAAQTLLPEKTWTPPPRDEHAAVMRAQSEKIAAQRAEEEKRRQATASYGKAAAALDDLSTYFRTPGNMSFGDALREVNLRLGPQGVTVLEKVAAVYPHFSKQADTKKPHFGDNVVYGLVQTVLDSVGAYNDAQSKVSIKKSEAVCKKTAPKFLTGSILAADGPLELKEAARKPFEFGSRKGGPGTNPLGGGSGYQGGDPAPEPEPPFPPTAANQKLDELAGRLDNVGEPIPSFDAEMSNIANRQQQDKEIEDIIGRERDSGQAAAKEMRDRDLAENDKRINAENEKLRAEARDWEDAHNPTPERAEELQQQNMQDYWSQQDDAQRQKAERNRAEKAEHDANTEMRDKWRKGLDEQKELKKKERDEFKNYGKGIGADIGKAFKGDFMGNASAPIKTIGGLLGAKSVADMSPVQKKDPSKVLREQYQKLTDPSHENAIKTIRAKSILHDMVLNDPVISGYDPQDVAMAFNEIAELAPSLVDAPGMIRPLLRKRLESGQLADFDVKQILDMDKLRADRDKALMETKEKTLNLL